MPLVSATPSVGLQVAHVALSISLSFLSLLLQTIPRNRNSGAKHPVSFCKEKAARRRLFLEECLDVADAQNSQRLPILQGARELRSGHMCAMCFFHVFFFLSPVFSFWGFLSPSGVGRSHRRPPESSKTMGLVRCQPEAEGLATRPAMLFWGPGK